MLNLLYVKQCGRRLKIPAGPLIAGSVWTLFVLTAVYIARRYNTALNLCIFKLITGIPCPTCGSTTGSFLILKGMPVRGWLQNPLVFTLMPLLFLNLVFQLVTGYGIRFNYSGSRRIIITVLIIIVILANWGYLIIREVVI